jgi:hypothetical protein
MADMRSVLAAVANIVISIIRLTIAGRPIIPRRGSTGCTATGAGALSGDPSGRNPQPGPPTPTEPFVKAPAKVGCGATVSTRGHHARWLNRAVGGHFLDLDCSTPSGHLTASTRQPSPAARHATSRPMWPSPTTPTVWPPISPRTAPPTIGLQHHDPSRNDVAMSNRRWRQASIIMIANSPSAGSWPYASHRVTPLGSEETSMPSVPARVRIPTAADLASSTSSSHSHSRVMTITRATGCGRGPDSRSMHEWNRRATGATR